MTRRLWGQGQSWGPFVSTERPGFTAPWGTRPLLLSSARQSQRCIYRPPRKASPPSNLPLVLLDCFAYGILLAPTPAPSLHPLLKWLPHPATISLCPSLKLFGGICLALVASGWDSDIVPSLAGQCRYCNCRAGCG